MPAGEDRAAAEDRHAAPAALRRTQQPPAPSAVMAGRPLEAHGVLFALPVPAATPLPIGKDHMVRFRPQWRTAFTDGVSIRCDLANPIRPNLRLPGQIDIAPANSPASDRRSRTASTDQAVAEPPSSSIASRPFALFSNSLRWARPFSPPLILRVSPTTSSASASWFSLFLSQKYTAECTA